MGKMGWDGTGLPSPACSHADGASLFSCSLAGEEREQDPPCRLCFKHYGFLDTDNVPRDSLEFALLFEQVRAVMRWQRRATLGWPCYAMPWRPCHAML